MPKPTKAKSFLTTEVQKNWITKANRFNEIRYHLSVPTQKLINVFACLIAKDDELFKLYQVSARELAELIGIDVLKKGYKKELQKYIDELKEKKNWIVERDHQGQEVFSTPWYSSLDWIGPDRDLIEFEFSVKLKPLLLQLKNKYYQFKYISIEQLKKDYSIRLYERCKEKYGSEKGNWKEGIETLRLILGIQDEKYTNFNDLQKRVLIPAIEEINTKTDMFISTYEPIKIGKTYTYVQFKVVSNDNNKNTSQDISDYTPKSARITEYKYNTSNKNSVEVNKIIDGYNQKYRLGRISVEFTQYVKDSGFILIKNQNGGWNLAVDSQMDIEFDFNNLKQKNQIFIQILKEDKVNDVLIQSIVLSSNVEEWHTIKEKIFQSDAKLSTEIIIAKALAWMKSKYNFD